MAFVPVTIAGKRLIVFVGRSAKGPTGFGCAVPGSGILASVTESATAATILILSILFATITLLEELVRQGFVGFLSRCWIYLLVGIIGTLAGMPLPHPIPRGGMALAVGVLTGGRYVPGQAWLAERCGRPGVGVNAGVGVASGIAFVATGRRLFGHG